MFKDYKVALQENVKKLLEGQDKIYLTNVNRDHLWDTFLAGFPEEERNGYTCNCCRQFIKNYGNMAVLKGNKLVSIWDFKAEGYYQNVNEVLNAFVTSAEIANVFVTTFNKLGTDTSVQGMPDGSTHRWHHLFLELPMSFKTRSSLTEDTIKGQFRDSKSVFKRSLEEISIDATETVLELIAQNSLYRGAESLGVIQTFLKYQKEYNALFEYEKDNYAWRVGTTDQVIARIKNHAIGTVLTDLSKGVELDDAIRKFEAIMAPTNYKRPQAIYTKKMIEEAEKTLTDMGLVTALQRRFATMDDLTVNNVLFVNRENKPKGIFDTMSDDVAVNPKSLQKVEAISLADFIKNVLPFSTSIEVLLENQHEAKLVSLIAPSDPEAGNLFKWNNNFSWSYNNALTDSLKEKVKTAGGKVDGLLRCSLEWYNYDDLDLHLVEPDNNRIYFSNPRSRTGGELDVDMNAGGGRSRTPVENIIYPHGSTIKDGKYTLIVNNFSKRENIDVGFNVEIEFAGEVYTFAQSKAVPGGASVIVAEFNYSKKDGIKFKDGTVMSTKTHSREVWGIHTSRFIKVKSIMFSPNHWEENGNGNKHVFLMLENANNTGDVRGFFNEFLKEDLNKYKKVFEALAGKIKVEHTLKQLSGLGFSTTATGEFYCRVTGKFTRTLKVTI